MRQLSARLQALTSRQILLIGGLGMLLYAFPGYMSFDSITQLRQARSEYLLDGHPPAMAAMWRVVELFVAGPLGMLLIQIATFLVGAYLIFARYMAPRRAAIAAALVLWFPPIGSVMAVIWKDSQMTGFMLLGFGLMLQDSRRARIGGLVALVAAEAMRHNAVLVVGPLVVLCFVWDARHRFVKRHALALAAFVGVTLSAQLITHVLTSEEEHVWHTKLALADIAGTLHHAPTIPSAELAQMLDGVGVLQPDPQAFLRSRIVDSNYVDTLWKTTVDLFVRPRTEAERSAVTRAWKRVVLGHRDDYLAYRWEIYRRMLGLDADEPPLQVYNWFADIQDPFLSADRAGQDANPAHVQDLLRRAMQWTAATPMFNVMMYLILAVLLIPFAFRDRSVLALLVSGLFGEATLFILAPTSDWRYSYWMILAVIVAVVILVAERMRPERTA